MRDKIWLSFGHVEFEIPIRYPSGDVEGAVGHTSLEIQEKSELNNHKASIAYRGNLKS